MSSQVLLNGKMVDIDPSKHRYLGMFRFPYKPPECDMLCGCGCILRTLHDAMQHHQQGHSDTPQYIDIA